MTVLDDPPVGEEEVAPIVGDALGADDRARVTDAGPTKRSDDDDFVPPPLREVIRPVLAAAFSTMAAGLLTAGIFDSWSARAVAVVGSLGGPAWAAFALRSPKRSAAQAMLLPVLLVASIVVLLLLGGSPGELPTLIGDALESGRSLRPRCRSTPGGDRSS